MAPPPPPLPLILVAGNPTHDILIRDNDNDDDDDTNTILAHSLGGAASFISSVLSSLSLHSNSTFVSKAGPDFAYSHILPFPPIISPDSKTTLFHAHFTSNPGPLPNSDRVLKRVSACDPICPSDFLPRIGETRFRYGMAVGVGGEIGPDTLEKMIEICDVVFADIQGLIRVFDEVDDGKVRLIRLRDSGFYDLVPKLGFLKASAEEEAYFDVEEVRRMCCVVVTNGKNGCRVCWRDGEVRVGAFEAMEVDPTGAGDSFLGGFVAGLVHGLAVPDAALLGNFFGALTVEQVGLPVFDPALVQRVKAEAQKRRLQFSGSCGENKEELSFVKPVGHDEFHNSLAAVKRCYLSPQQEPRRDLSHLSNGAVNGY